ncbi:mg301 protein [Tupanvirus deep ocean]|uniref:Mg301 protein n=2 Tax=Tupanvirus TaxID=2094720 RepID=A0AC62AA25_9VIRU|nr:mg301 protein [Tupanvirus deep ocean]QKU34642.1 mg301 protein [Tupanvirus deep ocean]
MNSNNQNACADELDSWFNELDDKTIEIINNNLINEEDSDNDNASEQKTSAVTSDDDDDNLENTTKCISVEDILLKDPNTLTSYELIKHECSIAYFVQVLMEGSTINNKIKSLKPHDSDLTIDKMQSIVEYLNWISISSETLAKRINQELLVYKPDSKPCIVRSSYNFCTKYTQCKNFYSKHETPNCKEHHYVHSLLKYDVDSVIVFLNHVIKNSLSMTKEELNNLYLSIKTICFVTRHMAKEISYIDYITKNNSETFHRSNPIELNKKKNITKRVWSECDRSIRNERPPREKIDYHKNNKSFRNVNTSYANALSNNNERIERDDRSFIQNKRNVNNCGSQSNNRISYTKSSNVGGFKKTDSVKINKTDCVANRFSILSDTLGV